MASYGPANGNFKHGFNSMHCNPDRQLGTAADIRKQWLIAIENVCTGRIEGVPGHVVRQAQKIIDERPSWAAFVIDRFK
jgi:hypothetical protein